MKAITFVVALLAFCSGKAQHNRFLDSTEAGWVFPTLWNLKESGHLGIDYGFFRRILRIDVARAVLMSEKGLNADLVESERLIETNTKSREAYERSQKFAALYKDIDSLSMMVDVFSEEFTRLQIDEKALKRSLIELRSRNARVQVMSLLREETADSWPSADNYRQVSLSHPPDPSSKSQVATRDELAAQVDNLRRSADLTVDEATELLLSAPSFELLSMLTLPPDRHPGVASAITGIMPRPLAECTVATAMKIMRQLSELPTEKLKLVFDQCEALADELLVGKVPTKFTVIRPDGQFDYRWSEAWMEIGRKCALLLKYTFEAPDDLIYPWTYDTTGKLTLVPNPDGIPNNNRGNYGYPKALFDKYSKFPRRVH